MRKIALLLCLVPTFMFAQQIQLQKQLQQAIKEKKAEIGIAVIIDGKDTITVNNDVHYPLMSVYKFHQALGLAHYLDQKKQSLKTPILIKKEDLKPVTYSPLRDKFPEGGFEMSVADLLKYTLQLSDNNACDILFDYQGGTGLTNAYIHSLGVHDCEIKYTEHEMSQDVNRCYGNWSTPLAAAKLLEIFRHDTLFNKVYKDYIYQTMIECKTGLDRLAAPLLEKKVVIGHKTGTGPFNAKGQMIGCNDIGFVNLPDGRSYSIAVFVKDSNESPQENSQIIANLSRMVYDYVTQQPK